MTGQTTPPLDLAIIGGGPAGMSAALTAGRALLSTAIINTESPRDAVTTASHGLLTRDGAHPTELLATAKQQLTRYDTVAYLNDRVEDVTSTGDGFALNLSGGSRLVAARLIIATGHTDDLDQLERDAGFIGDEYSRPSTTFAASLGVPDATNDWGMTGPDATATGTTAVKGLYVVGDARTGFSGLVAAAAEGALCAESIVHEIATERWASR